MDNRVVSTVSVNSLSRTGFLAAVLAVLLGAGLTADAAVDSVADDIHACVNVTNGNVRIVAAGASCKPHESPLQWPGTAGPTGGGAIVVHGSGAGAPVSIEDPVCVHITGAGCDYRAPRDGTIQNVKLVMESNSYDSSATVAVYVNGVATALSTTIPAGSTADIDIPGSVAISSGDRIAVRLDRSGVTTGTIFVNVSYEVQ